ncbi:hypothetical protein N071400001_p11280 (plasmid) [Clostridium tetani]|nr:hypothetical protein K154306013_p11120 [Clostridium tetani]BDR88193.1 hypothetical protein N071400001_p11280 [Clostridium tetani]SUY82435.1 Uncharacterised protein [Clostridium tetani]
MIIIATGYHKLDNLIKEKISDSQIINYREFLIKEKRNP